MVKFDLSLLYIQRMCKSVNYSCNLNELQSNSVKTNLDVTHVRYNKQMFSIFWSEIYLQYINQPSYDKILFITNTLSGPKQFVLTEFICISG